MLRGQAWVRVAVPPTRAVLLRLLRVRVHQAVQLQAHLPAAQVVALLVALRHHLLRAAVRLPAHLQIILR